MVASNRGKKVKFIHCLWENMTATSGVVFIGNNNFQKMANLGIIEPQSAEIVFEDCIFRNIEYDRTFIAIEEQSLVLRRCRFEGITVPILPSLCLDHGIGGYCQGLIYCERNSHCSLQDICVDGLDYAGLSAVLVAAHGAKISLSGTHSLQGIRLSPQAREVKHCDSGFSRFWEGSQFSELNSICVSQESLESMWTPSASCIMDSTADNTVVNNIPVQSFDYDCYSSTFQLAADHFYDPSKTLFVMCPNTTIHLGTLANPITGNVDIIEGDFPLAIVRSNVEVRCGLDGAVENNCVIKGGAFHVIMSPRYPNGLESERTDNVTIRGMTFTGQLSGESTFNAASVVVSNPGSVLFVDCLWKDISVPYDLIFVGSNNFQEVTNEDDLDPQVASLTIANCTLRNVMYGATVIGASKQILTVSRTRFEAVRLSPYFPKCSTGPEDGWCQSLVRCIDESVCKLEDICAEGIEYAGRAALLHANRESQIYYSGLQYLNGTRQVKVGGNDPPCPNGLAWLSRMSDSFRSICLEDGEINGTQVENVDTCFLGQT